MNTEKAAGTETIDVLTLLTLPSLSSLLTKEQRRGASCVWCSTTLTGETAIDFGARSGTFMGAVERWFPRGCRACVRKAACKSYETHPRTCEQCVDDATVCDTRRALRRLALQGRR